MKLIRYGGFALLAAVLLYSTPQAMTAPSLMGTDTGQAIIPDDLGKTTTPALAWGPTADDLADVSVAGFADNRDGSMIDQQAPTAETADTAASTEGTPLSAGTKVENVPSDNSEMMAAKKLPTGAIAKAPTEKTAPTPNPLL